MLAVCKCHTLLVYLLYCCNGYAGSFNIKLVPFSLRGFTVQLNLSPSADSLASKINVY